MSEPAFLALACVAALLVGLSKGGLPTVGLLAVPLLSLAVSPILAASILLPIYIVSDAVGVWLYRHAFSRRNLLILIPGGVAGVALGWSTAALVPERVVSGLLGLIGVSFCLNLWWGRRPVHQGQPGGVGRGLFWGALSGFTSFVSHAGSPPYQVYVLPQGLPKAVFAGTTTLYFAVINLVKVVPYVQLRPYTLADAAAMAWMVPAALLGTFVGAWLTRVLADAWFFRLVQAGLFLISLKLLWDALRP